MYQSEGINRSTSESNYEHQVEQQSYTMDVTIKSTCVKVKNQLCVWSIYIYKAKARANSK